MTGHISHATDLDLPIVDLKMLHHNSNKNTLMTKVSNFPGRRLPPRGAQPTALDDNLDFKFKVINSTCPCMYDQRPNSPSRLIILCSFASLMRRGRLGAAGGGELCLNLCIFDIRFVLDHICKLHIPISSEKLGCRVPGYRVRCTFRSGATSAQIYCPFLGEICRVIGEHINTSPALCNSRLKIAVYIPQGGELYL